MKKLVFAAVAALAIVSAGNVFASVQNSDKAMVASPADTTVTTAPADTAQAPAPSDTAQAQ